MRAALRLRIVGSLKFLHVLAYPGYVGHLPATLDFAPAAPVLCAGVTVYKGLKMLDCKPGDWVAILGIGGRVVLEI